MDLRYKRRVISNPLAVISLRLPVFVGPQLRLRGPVKGGDSILPKRPRRRQFVTPGAVYTIVAARPGQH